jgi:hypothetical protein
MVYVEYCEVFGQPATLGELTKTIARYPLKEWLAILSRIEFYFESDKQDF